MLSKRSCRHCRRSKCDRAPAGCARCKRGGHECVYAALDDSLRVRDQTDRAERHAVGAWRARAKHAPSPASSQESIAIAPLELPLATDVKTLALNRFIYDFSGSKNRLSAFSNEQLSPLTSALTKGGQRERDGAEAAFIATSLANLYTRHLDSRAASLVPPALGKAISSLAISLRSPQANVTHQMVLTAILLGLHQTDTQNISPDQHLIGSWVHHFRGSMHLLEAAARHGLSKTTYNSLLQLVEKQALCVSLRMELPFPVPARMRDNLASRTDFRSQTLALGACVSDYCAKARNSKYDFVHSERSELVERWKDLNAKFDELEAELQLVLPYRTFSADVHIYPRWYQSISTKAGGPSSVHSYTSEDDVAIWNAERMARMKLHSIALTSSLYQSIASTTIKDSNDSSHITQHALVTSVLRLVEDLRASVFYCLSHQSPGSLRICSFEDVPGAKGFSLISPLALAADCLRRLPEPKVGVEECEWLEHVLGVIRERLGISEALCWKNEDDEVARARFERTLRLDMTA